jgi:hypothetical protein
MKEETAKKSVIVVLIASGAVLFFKSFLRWLLK